MSEFAFRVRDPVPLLEQALRGWDRRQDLWIFGYASLIWRPEFDYIEKRLATVHGWHRALKMWSRVNRGTPELPGLVFAMLPGGSCRGVVFRVARSDGPAVFERLWAREMPTGVYDPRWLPCRTDRGVVRALTFTLSRSSPNYTGQLSDDTYRRIFAHARGRYGTTLDYAQRTLDDLRAHDIHDRALEHLLRHARPR